MLRFVGGSVLIVGVVSALLYLAGYWNGSLEVTITDTGRKTISKVADKSRETISDGLDSLQEVIKKEPVKQQTKDQK